MPAKQYLVLQRTRRTRSRIRERPNRSNSNLSLAPRYSKLKCKTCETWFKIKRQGSTPELLEVPSIRTLVAVYNRLWLEVQNITVKARTRLGTKIFFHQEPPTTTLEPTWLISKFSRRMVASYFLREVPACKCRTSWRRETSSKTQTEAKALEQLCQARAST